LIAEPGSRYQYSGGGYTVLQLIVEEVTKTNFDVWMNAGVLALLGMTESRFGWAEGDDRRAATPYDEYGKPLPRLHFVELAAARPSSRRRAARARSATPRPFTPFRSLAEPAAAAFATQPRIQFGWSSSAARRLDEPLRRHARPLALRRFSNAMRSGRPWTLVDETRPRTSKTTIPTSTGVQQRFTKSTRVKRCDVNCDVGATL
jgi:CubicO group peptidase (beta-lactamase class C family)